MSGQQSLGLKLGQPVETKPAGAPVGTAWWQVEGFRLWLEQGLAESESAIEVRGGRIFGLVPGWFATSRSSLIGHALLSEPKVGERVDLEVEVSSPVRWIERNIGDALSNWSGTRLTQAAQEATSP